MSDTPLEQFHRAHGGDFVTSSGLLFYPDGACREPHRFGKLLEVPSDPVELNRRLVRYWTIKTQQAIEQFDHKKKELLSAARAQLMQKGNPGGPATELSEAKAQLALLREKVTSCKAELERVKAALEAAEPEKQREAAIAAENRQRLTEYVSELQQIEI